MQLLELISLDATDCSASKLFQNFKDLLEKKYTFKKYNRNGK